MTTQINKNMPAASEQEEGEGKKTTPAKQILKRLAKNKLALMGGIIFICLCLIAIFADVIAPYDYSTIDTSNKFCRPCAEHLFGTDEFGRDIFSRIVYGGRWSLSLGLCAALMSTTVAIVIGSIAGYFGGRVDSIIMRFTDMIQCIPGILLLICLSTVLGGGFFNTVLAMSIGGIWGGVRMLRGQILTVRGNAYVEAAKATNNPEHRIIIRYIIPNAIQPMIINACMGIGGTIMMAAGLSFLGLGIQPPLPEWGAMLSGSRTYLRYYPNMLVAPGLMIALTVLSISLFGDGLRDALDPRLRD